MNIGVAHIRSRHYPWAEREDPGKKTLSWHSDFFGEGMTMAHWMAEKSRGVLRCWNLLENYSGGCGGNLFMGAILPEALHYKTQGESWGNTTKYQKILLASLCCWQACTAGAGCWRSCEQAQLNKKGKHLPSCNLSPVVSASKGLILC